MNDRPYQRSLDNALAEYEFSCGKRASEIYATRAGYTRMMKEGVVVPDNVRIIILESEQERAERLKAEMEVPPVTRHLVALILILVILVIGLNYAFSATEQPIFADGFEAPADYCAALAENPLVQPPAWQRVNKTWLQAFRTASNPNPVYPDSGGAPVPLKVVRGTYASIEIVPLPNQFVSLSWEEAQSLPGYSSLRRQGAMFFSLSPCPGDFRPSDFGASGDPWLTFGCRKGPTRSGGLVWHTAANPSNNSSCQLQAGQLYYLNQISADPNDGLTPGEHKCDFETSPGCDVIATQHPN